MTEGLFDLPADTGGRAVDETRTNAGRRSRTNDKRTSPCPRCGQQVLPGPHTRPGHPVTICQETHP